MQNNQPFPHDRPFRDDPRWPETWNKCYEIARCEALKYCKGDEVRAQTLINKLEDRWANYVWNARKTRNNDKQERLEPYTPQELERMTPEAIKNFFLDDEKERGRFSSLTGNESHEQSVDRDVDQFIQDEIYRILRQATIEAIEQMKRDLLVGDGTFREKSLTMDDYEIWKLSRRDNVPIPLIAMQRGVAASILYRREARIHILIVKEAIRHLNRADMELFQWLLKQAYPDLLQSWLSKTPVKDVESFCEIQFHHTPLPELVTNLKMSAPAVYESARRVQQKLEGRLKKEHKQDPLLVPGWFLDLCMTPIRIPEELN